VKLLLDTHVFLWYIAADPLLPARFRDAIRDPANTVFLSVASVWEAVITHALGKLPMPASPAEYLPIQRQRHGIASLLIDEGAFSHLAGLPPHHRDPFDRLIIAQTNQHGMSLLTVDDAVRAYPVKLFAAG
jgi:PIN domain nuclease of toxin-antitoxin system